MDLFLMDVETIDDKWKDWMVMRELLDSNSVMNDSQATRLVTRLAMARAMEMDACPGTGACPMQIKFSHAT